MKVKQEFWIARDSGGKLYLYDRMPEVDFRGVFYAPYCEDTYVMELRSHLFPDVTVENSPQRVHIKRIKLI
jgi:hypothetical protein